MASDNEASCESDPNFAVICAFLEKFGPQCGISDIDFLRLQLMLENTQEVSQYIIDLHVKLMRKIKKSVPVDKWEKVLVKICHTFSSNIAWEIERFGYKKARTSSKVKVLKELLEKQFDCNTRFKTEINKLTADNLRAQPLGRDKSGHAYWFQSDDNYQIRVYKEDLDDEKWRLVAKDREGLITLINLLNDGDWKLSSDSAGNEDSNSLSEKPIIDTGQTDLDSKKTTPDDSEDSNQHKKEDEEESSLAKDLSIKMDGDDDEEEPEKSKDVLKLKNLNNLVGSPKRAREDDEIGEEELQKKKIQNIDDEPPVSEAIEEPVMKIKGEGSGEENEGVFEENPIVGEEIQEEIVYIFGDGDGAACQTGNEKDSGEHSLTSPDTNSISDKKNNHSDNNLKEVPFTCKLGVISDSKTDCVGKKASPTKKSRWDIEHSTSSEKEEIEEEVPKKQVFFFGPKTSPLKSNLFSPLNICFGSPKQETGEFSGKLQKCGEHLEVPSNLPVSSQVLKKEDKTSESEKTNNGETNENIPESENMNVKSENVKSDSNSQIMCGDSIRGLVSVSEFANEEKTKEKTEKPESTSAVEELAVKEEEDSKETDVNKICDVSEKFEECEGNGATEIIVGHTKDETTKTDLCKNETRKYTNSKEEIILKDLKNKDDIIEKVITNEPDQIVSEELKIETQTNENIVLKEEVKKKEDIVSEDKPNVNNSLKADTMAEDLNEPVIEPECVKKTAYVCGVEEEKDITLVQAAFKHVETKPIELPCKTTDPNQENASQTIDIRKENGKSEVDNSLLQDRSCDDCVPEKSNIETTSPKVEKPSPNVEISSPCKNIEESETKDPCKEDLDNKPIEQTEKMMSTTEDKEHKVTEDLVEKPEQNNILSPLSKDNTDKAIDQIPSDEDLEDKPETTEETKNTEHKATGILVEKPEINNITLPQSNINTDEVISRNEDLESKPVVQTEEMKITSTTENIEHKIENLVEEPQPNNILSLLSKKKSEITIDDISNNEDLQNKKLKKISATEDIEQEVTENILGKCELNSTLTPQHKHNIAKTTDEISSQEDLQNKPMKQTKTTLTADDIEANIPENVMENREVNNILSPPSKDITDTEKNTEHDSNIQVTKTKEVIQKEDNPSKEANIEEEVSSPEQNDDNVTGISSHESSPRNSPEAVMDILVSEAEDNSEALDSSSKDPLAVSGEDQDEEKKPKQKVEEVKKPVSLMSFSLDFNESPTPTPVPTISPLRQLRKRVREDATSDATALAEKAPGKKMKLKGKRQVDAQLRRSIEQQKEEQISSSEKGSEDEKPTKSSRGKKGKAKKESTVEISDNETRDANPTPTKGKRKYKNRMLANLGIDENQPIEHVGVRQSRRIAQLKIKEQVEQRRHDPKPVEEKKKSKKAKEEDKNYKAEKRKRNKHDKEDTSEPETVSEKRKKKKKEKAPSKLFDHSCPWKSSSDSSDEGGEDIEEEEEEEDEPPLEFKSDHEFSPESEEDEAEWQPPKRARTARKESDAEEVDDCPCQKCGKSDHPEWVLLCDSCDNGWHCSCLRPALLVIPEGDWYCPPCEHTQLLEKLQVKLIDYDKKLSKKSIEDRRKERLAYVGISLNNVLPSKDQELSKKKRSHSMDEFSSERSSTGSESESESESDSDEPIYQLRQRRQGRSYKFNEYDEMIKSALDEVDDTKQCSSYQSRGKDIATIIKGQEPEPLPQESARDEEEENVRPVRTKKFGRKKHRKLNSLEINSEDEDDNSDEDFKGSNSDSDEEEDESEGTPDSDDSDDYVGRKRRKNGPVRRSTRARTKRYDADFIDDNDSEEEAPRRKKKKSIWDETESEDSEGSWGRKGKRGGKSSPLKKKKKKNKPFDPDDSDLDTKKSKSRIKYGGLESSDEDLGRGRRTRGKKTTYIDTLGSDSEEETRKKNPRKIESDEDDEDFVANDEDEADEEEKDSEENVQEEEDDDSEQEVEERRKLLVPKIYIKPPSIAKKISPSLTTETEESQINVDPKVVLNDVAKTQDVTGAVKTKENDDHKSEFKNLTVMGKATIGPEKNTLNRVEIKPNDTIIQLNKNIENMDPKDMQKLMEEEDFANQQLKMVAAQLHSKGIQQEPQHSLLHQNVLSPDSLEEGGNNTALSRTPVKRTRKPKLMHEPIVSNVSALIRNDVENDDLSEPPGFSLPMFDELATSSKSTGDETPKKRRGRGRPKKSLEEAVANLGDKKPGSKNNSPKKPGENPNMEIAAPPQPFSQSQPAPSVITRMLQSKPGQAINYPVGTIRPKQFATMPIEDDETDESRSRGASPAVASVPGPVAVTPPNMGQYMQGTPAGSRGPPPGGLYRPGLPPPINHHYLRGIPPAHQLRGPPPTNLSPQTYNHPHRPMDPSPSGGGQINMSDVHQSRVVPSSEANSPGRVSRYSPASIPPVSMAPNVTIANTRPPMHLLPPRPANIIPYPSNGPPPAPPHSYYENYPSPSMTNEDALPPTPYQNSPYHEQYGAGADVGSNISENSNGNKAYEEESGGEFGGLVSYFSSQHEDDLES